MDFAKAFDVIDHDLLLRKLTLYGLSNDTLHLISSFLSNRKQLVCINTNVSKCSLYVFTIIPPRLTDQCNFITVL